MCHGDRPITSRCSMTAHPKKSSCHSIASDIGARGPARKPVGRYARLDNNTRRTATAGAQQKQQQQQQHQQPREYYVAPPSRHLSARVHPTNPLSPPTHRVRPERAPVSLPPSISSPRYATKHPTLAPEFSPHLDFPSSSPPASGRPYHVLRPPLRCQRGGSRCG